MLNLYPESMICTFSL